MSKLPVPESLREVWRWKEAVAKEYAGLSRSEIARKLNETADRLLAERGITLRRLRTGQKAK